MEAERIALLHLLVALWPPCSTDTADSSENPGSLAPPCCALPMGAGLAPAVLPTRHPLCLVPIVVALMRHLPAPAYCYTAVPCLASWWSPSHHHLKLLASCCAPEPRSSALLVSPPCFVALPVCLPARNSLFGLQPDGEPRVRQPVPLAHLSSPSPIVPSSVAHTKVHDAQHTSHFILHEPCPSSFVCLLVWSLAVRVATLQHGPNS